MIEVVYATRDIVARMQDGARHTQRAVAVMDGDTVLGVGGVRVEGERLVMFAEISDALRANKRALVRGMRALMKLADRGIQVHAAADPDIEGSDRLLAHMGFEHAQDEVWVWQPGYR